MYYFKVTGVFCKEMLSPHGIKYDSARRKPFPSLLPDLRCGACCHYLSPSAQGEKSAAPRLQLKKLITKGKKKKKAGKNL